MEFIVLLGVILVLLVIVLVQQHRNKKHLQKQQQEIRGDTSLQDYSEPLDVDEYVASVRRKRNEPTINYVDPPQQRRPETRDESYVHIADTSSYDSGCSSSGDGGSCGGGSD